MEETSQDETSDANSVGVCILPQSPSDATVSVLQSVLFHAHFGVKSTIIYEGGGATHKMLRALGEEQGIGETFNHC